MWNPFRQGDQELSSGKAPRHDSIPAKLCKDGDLHMILRQMKLFCVFWRKGQCAQRPYGCIFYIHVQAKSKPLLIIGKSQARMVLTRLANRIVNKVNHESQS